MADIPMLKTGFETVSAFVGAVLAVAGIVRWLVRKELPRRRERRATQQAINEVLLGRPAIPFNRITGAKAQPAIPSIGQQVTELRERVDDIHHEVHPNGGGSMRDDINTIKKRQTDDYMRFEAIDDQLVRIKKVLADELHAAHDTVANAAEAAATLLPTIHDAIKAQPPEE